MREESRAVEEGREGRRKEGGRWEAGRGVAMNAEDEFGGMADGGTMRRKAEHEVEAGCRVQEEAAAADRMASARGRAESKRGRRG